MTNIPGGFGSDPCGCADPAGAQAPFVTVPFDAKRQNQRSATSPATVGWEPYLIALDQPLPGTYQLVTAIQALIYCPNPPQDPPVGPGASPGSGLFIVPAGDVGETLAQASRTLNPRTRAIGLDTGINATFIPSETRYLVQFVWRSGAGPLVVPGGYQLVAIVCPHPGTAQPGPGAGAVGQLNALLSVENQNG